MCSNFFVTFHSLQFVQFYKCQGFWINILIRLMRNFKLFTKICGFKNEKYTWVITQNSFVALKWIFYNNLLAVNIVQHFCVRYQCYLLKFRSCWLCLFCIRPLSIIWIKINNVINLLNFQRTTRKSPTWRTQRDTANAQCLELSTS